MTTRRDIRRQAAATEAAERFLTQWRFVVSAGQGLWIQPTAATLAPADLAGLLERMRDGGVAESVAEICFDFGEVQTIAPHWTLVFAMLIGFARSVKARCRVVSLKGQALAAAALYGRNRELAALLAA